MAPGYAGSKASLAVPVKVGHQPRQLLRAEYRHADAPVFVDNTFGYFSVAGLVTVPLGGTTSFGAWNVHGGVEFQALGDTTKALNGGDGHGHRLGRASGSLTKEVHSCSIWSSSVSVLFFVVSIGYVAACDRLMK